MVRLKNRWLIARVDFAEEKAALPSKRDLFLLLNDNIIENFGIIWSGALRETRGTLTDACRLMKNVVD